LGLSDIHPGLLIWMFLAVPASGISFFLSYPDPSCMFHLFFCMMNLGAIFVMWSGWFQDLAEDSMDWGDRSPSLTANWSLIGLAALFMVSLGLGFIFTNQLTPAFWVPHDLYPLALESSVLTFALAIFGTWFSVIPGEEGMKILISVVYKAYQKYDWELPFAFHPARLIGNAVWSVLHVIKGQYAYTFFFSVFVSGTVMDSSSAQSGTILTNYFIHALFNTFVLCGSFLLGGALTVVW